MAFRKCERHGWLSTPEYVTNKQGETICPVCRKGLHDFRNDGDEPDEYEYRETMEEAAQDYVEAYVP